MGLVVLLFGQLTASAPGNIHHRRLLRWYNLLRFACGESFVSRQGGLIDADEGR